MTKVKKPIAAGMAEFLSDNTSVEVPLVLEKTKTTVDENPIYVGVLEVPKVKKTLNYDRVTTQIDKELYSKVKIMAHWELTTITDIINSALSKTVVQYEKTHGELVKVPKSKL